MQVELTTEQRFAIAAFASQVNKMSEQQAKEFLVALYEQALIREKLCLSLIRPERQPDLPPFLKP